MHGTTIKKNLICNYSLSPGRKNMKVATVPSALLLTSLKIYF
jgi:hypothetical protein